MTDLPEPPSVAWHLPSWSAEWRWTISVLIIPQLAALLAIAFFARGLAYTPVPVVRVNASVYQPVRGMWSESRRRSYELQGDFAVQTPAGVVPGSRFTTSDCLLYTRYSPAALERLAADLNARTIAYHGRWFNEVLLDREMPPVAMPIVLFAFALAAGACESWTRILHMGEPPSRREGKKLRASTAPLLQFWMIGAAIAGGIGFYVFGLFALVVPLWISLPALLIADGGSVLLWWWGWGGKLLGWARE